MLLKSLRKKVDRFCSILESFFSQSWLNPFATVWLCFRCLELKDAARLPVWAYGRPRLCSLKGRIILIGDVKTGAIKVNYIRPWAPSLMTGQTELINDGEMQLAAGVVIGTGCRIKVHKGGVLQLGEDVLLADESIVNCTVTISVGDRSQVTHRCLLNNEVTDTEKQSNNHQSPAAHADIIIGKECWVCNASAIEGGGNLGDNLILTSNSVCGSDFSDVTPYDIIGGIPAKIIGHGNRRVWDHRQELELIDFFDNNPEGTYLMDEA